MARASTSVGGTKGVPNDDTSHRVATMRLDTPSDLDARGHHNEAVAVYDELLERFGSATGSGLRATIAVAKAVALDALSRREDAAVTFLEVLERFGSAKFIKNLKKEQENNTSIADEESGSYTGDNLNGALFVGGTTELRQKRAEKAFEMLTHLEPTKQEILQLTDAQLAEALARRFRTSVDDASTLVGAMQINSATVIETSKKIVTRKPKLSIKDFSEAELNDPKVIQTAHNTVNENRRNRIEALSEEKQHELRRARLLVQYDRGRRDRQSVPP